MDEVPGCADARHAMQTTLRYEQQHARPEPLRQGRFGRAPEIPQHPVSDAIPSEPDERLARFDLQHYEVDPDAVARAILERLAAGRTIRPADRG